MEGAEEGEKGTVKADRERELARMMLWIETAKEKLKQFNFAMPQWFDTVSKDMFAFAGQLPTLAQPQEVLEYKQYSHKLCLVSESNFFQN